MAAGKGVKLYGMWASPAVRRVEWALKKKGIKYEYIEEDLSNKSFELLQYNPITKQVPVLVHDGKPVMESLVILEYIDEVWKGNPILPKDAYERAKAQFWASFSEDKVICFRIIDYFYFSLFFLFYHFHLKNEIVCDRHLFFKKKIRKLIFFFLISE